jgi:hypothetical protein
MPLPQCPGDKKNDKRGNRPDTRQLIHQPEWPLFQKPCYHVLQGNKRGTTKEGSDLYLGEGVCGQLHESSEADDGPAIGVGHMERHQATLQAPHRGPFTTALCFLVTELPEDA